MRIEREKERLLSSVSTDDIVNNIIFDDDGILLLDEICHLTSAYKKWWRRRRTTTVWKIKSTNKKSREKNCRCIINYRFVTTMIGINLCLFRC